MLRRSEAEMARWPVTQLAKGGKTRLDSVEVTGHCFEETIASLRRHNASGGAGQQTDAHPFFKPPNGVAQGRLGDAKPRGRTGEAPLTSDCDEGHKVVQVFTRHRRSFIRTCFMS